MSKARLIIFLLTLIIVLGLAAILSFYARGYRLNSGDFTIKPHGLLVIKSNPDGAQVYINGELNTATNATVSLLPGDYEVSVKKEGYIEWKKLLNIQKEIVTEASAQLFKSAPSLSAITFSGVENPTPSRDFTKIAYSVPPSKDETIEEGLWVTETINLPLGFAREPRRITDGDLTGASYVWSPDGRQILLTTSKGSYLLDTSNFTTQLNRVNVQAKKDETLTKWQEDEKKLVLAQIKKLPEEIQDVLSKRSSSVVFSPDEDMILYTASSDATIKKDLIKELPGTSTQTENSDIKPYNTYVYDIKEDRNFLVDDHSKDLQIEGGFSDGFTRKMTWHTSSRNLVLSEKDQVIIMDYDGTNRKTVYSGVYSAPNAFPTLSQDRILILTNFGSLTPANLYSVTIK
jgi:hypothetical protein